jgi:hypothetical protein
LNALFPRHDLAPEESSMSPILIDSITNVTFVGGLVRVDCTAAGPNNEQRLSGTLLIPAAQAATIVNALASALRELHSRQRDQATPAGTA